MIKQKQTRVFIVDDSATAVAVLRQKLEKNYAVEVVGTAADAESAANQIITTDPDLIFLDVELPTMSGLEFSTMIRPELKPDAKIVFYTGHDKYMLEAIRKQAFDYLMKPPTDQDLAQLMTRYYEDKLSGIPQAVGIAEHLPIILVVNDMNEHTTMSFADIAFFRYNKERKIWEAVCLDNKTYMLRHRTTADVILRYSSDLVQIHKRYIVNISQIKMIYGASCILKEPMGKVDELKISKNYRPALMAAFYSL